MTDCPVCLDGDCAHCPDRDPPGCEHCQGTGRCQCCQPEGKSRVSRPNADAITIHDASQVGMARAIAFYEGLT